VHEKHLDMARIHRINHYPVDSVVCLVNPFKLCVGSPFSVIFLSAFLPSPIFFQPFLFSLLPKPFLSFQNKSLQHKSEVPNTARQKQTSHEPVGLREWIK